MTNQVMDVAEVQKTTNVCSSLKQLSRSYVSIPIISDIVFINTRVKSKVMFPGALHNAAQSLGSAVLLILQHCSR